MKGAKKGKGDTRSSTQVYGGDRGGSGNANETGALFPRLQLKEAKWDGPRAPPRNKMALYEQFSFPSHQYVPPSLPLPAQKPPTTSPPQRSSYEGSMFFGPPPTFGGMSGMTGMPWMPYSEKDHGSYLVGQPSVNGSSSSTIVDSEGNAGQGAGLPFSNAAGGGSPWRSSHANVESISSKKAKKNNDRIVPTHDPPASTSHGSSTPAVRSDHFSARAGHQRRVDTATPRKPGSVSSNRQLDSLSRAMSRTSKGNHASGGVSKGGKIGEHSRKVGNKGRGEEDESELRECTLAQKEKDPMGQQRRHLENLDSHYTNAQHGNNQHQQRQFSPTDVIPDVECARSQANSSGECLTELEENQRHSSKVSHEEGRIKGSQGKDSALTNTTARDTTQTENRRGQDIGEQKSKQLQESECISISSAGSGDDLEIISVPEVSQVSQSEEGQSGTGLFDAGEADSEFGRIAPKDIGKAMGEQEFWRARNLILRQEKIFSTQLFELHRIIKVQQLLAESPDAGMVSSLWGQPEEASEPDQANYEEDADKGNQNTEAFVGVQEKPEDTEGKQPDSSGHSSTSDRMCDNPPCVNSEPGQNEALQVPGMLNTSPGVGSTASWSGQPYAEAGSNNWFGAVPAPNGAYMYQPYHGSFHSSQVNTMGGYNGAYRPVMCAPNTMETPSMSHFGMPRYEQQPNLMQDMYRYVSYPQQQWPTAMFCPPVPCNPGPSWYGVPLPMNGMNPTMRGPYGWYSEMALGLHQSCLPDHMRQPQEKTAQPVPTAVHPSLFVRQSPWVDSSNMQQAGGEGEGQRFPQQVQQTPLPSETRQITTRVFPKSRAHSSDEGNAHMGSRNSQGGAPFGGYEASAVDFRNPVPDSTSQDCEVSRSQRCAESEGKNGWRSYDGNYAPESSGNGDAADHQQSNADKPENHKFRGGSRQEMGSSGDRNGVTNSQLDSRKLPDSQMNALPLFPLAPALNGLENGRAGSQSSPGVIKAVPRTMVATAESTVEILLSIQKQRHQ